MIDFCLCCWSPLNGQERICPACGCDLTFFSRLSIEEKYILALGHPVVDNKMIAVSMLGKSGSQRAIPRLEKILWSPETDYYLLAEVLNALASIRNPKCLELIQMAAEKHPNRLISEKAGDVLRGLRDDGAPR